MTSKRTDNSSRIARRAVKQGARPSVSYQAEVEKSDTGNEKLLKAKRCVNISTLNVRSLRGNHKVYELIAAAEKYEIDIICVQEHRYYHPDIPVKIHTFEKGWTFLTSSGVKNDSEATIGGVGILLSPSAAKSFTNYERISDRLLAGTFNGNPKTTIISCYLPTNNGNENEVIECYNMLSSYTHRIPQHNVTIICGDFNAQIGSCKRCPFTFHKVTNNNGQHLEDFITETNMQCLSTKFQKHTKKLWSIKYANGTKGQIDYILINKKWKNSGINCQAYNSFRTIFSDHRIVTAKIRLSLRANKASINKTPRYDWSALLQNDDIQKKYTIEVRNRYQILQEEDRSNTANTIYQNIMKANNEAAQNCIPIKRKSQKRIPWETAEVEEKRQKIKNTPINSPIFETTRKELKECYEKEQQAYIKKKVDIIKTASINKRSRIAWETVNEISGRKTSNPSKIRAKDNSERLEKWKDHFSNLLGKNPSITDEPIQSIASNLSIKTGNFEIEELKYALKSLPNNKASGLDNIPGEVWKSGALNDHLLDICNRVYNQQKVNIWTQSCILPFPKKGDLGLAANYRGISLVPIAAKIFNKMLLSRIRPAVDKILRQNQNGFRPNRGTEAQILTLRRIIEGVKEKNLAAVLIFIDFRKAFDSIHRGKMESILEAYGLPSETIKAIMMLYSNTTAMVRTTDGDTDFFEILAGVLQGDTLSPFLFIICLDYALRIAADKHKDLGLTINKAKSSRYPPTKITDVDYADDLAALSDSIEDATKLLIEIEKAAKQIGLHINEGKTEFMAFNQTGTIESLEGKTIKRVDDFTYLGSHLASTEKDIIIRIGKAWAALNKLNVIWKSNLDRNLKIEFFRATVESVLLYGSSTWTLKKSLENRLNGNYTRMLRAVLNVSWSQHVTNTDLYRNMPKVTTTILKRRLRFSGHCWRSNEELIHQALLWHPKHGKRNRGRPVRSYIDQLEKDTGLNRTELPTAMEDRIAWRELVDDIRVSSTR